MVAPAAAQDGKNAWALEPYARVELGIVLSQSEDRDDELIINGDGGYLRGNVGVEFGNDATQFRVEADRIEVQRFDNATGRDNFNRDRLTASITQKLDDDWEVALRGRVYDDLVSVEATDTDETQVSAQVEYEPERAHRFRLRGTWRDREYDDGRGPGGTSTHGEGARADLGYRHRMGRYHYINFDLRAEEINSANPARSYTRESVDVSYTHPLNRDLRVRPALSLRQTRFVGRLTDKDDPRKDTQVVPELELLWWPDNWRIEAEAKYIITNSNEAIRDREGYRFSLSISYAF